MEITFNESSIKCCW